MILISGEKQFVTPPNAGNINSLENNEYDEQYGDESDDYADGKKINNSVVINKHMLYIYQFSSIEFSLL